MFKQGRIIFAAALAALCAACATATSPVATLSANSEIVLIGADETSGHSASDELDLLDRIGSPARLANR